MKNVISTLVACAAAFNFVAPASAQSVADFYKGKQIIIIVGYSPGGGYDAYARLVARHFGNKMPGKPTVIVQNMPGAGSLRAANHLFNAAAKDGTVFGTFSRNMPLMGVLGGNKNVQFDAEKFTWLGSPSSAEDDAYMLFVRKDSKVKSFQDLVRPGGPTVILGGTAQGATGNDVAELVRDALGARIKLIAGYRDTNALNPAIERGELDGRFVGLSSVASTAGHWLKPGGPVRALVQFARKTRHPDYKDVPTVRELTTDPKAKVLVNLAEIPYQLSRPFAGPPGIPADRAKALQTAFLDMTKEPAFLADSKKMGVDVSPVGAKDAADMLAELRAAPEEAKEYLRKLLFGDKKKK